MLRKGKSVSENIDAASFFNQYTERLSLTMGESVVDKKIGIVTIIDYNNYGNRLQNYASQQVLKKLGYETVTLKNEVAVSKQDKSLFEKIRDKKVTKLPSAVIKKIQYEMNIDFHRLRKECFIGFTNENIAISDYVLSDNRIPEGLSDRFDYFITGSDQVWNPRYRLGSSVDFLTFADKEKRVALSPSFGISEIPAKFQPSYKEWLSDFKSLSVREESGAKIIKELTGRDAEVLVDPTLLLDKKEWLEIARESSVKPKGKYLLTYFLGNIRKEDRAWIDKVTKQKKLEIVNLADPKDKDCFITGPSEFIDYIASASLVCTDSFHGSIFSILMETPFVVFERTENSKIQIGSRMVTLLKTMRLEDRHFNAVSKQEDVFQMEFAHTGDIISKEKKRVEDYLTKAFR